MSGETSGCMLCRIVRGELRADIVVETERIVGIVVQGEAHSRGHCVFFPKRHAPSLHDIDDRDLAEILPMIKRVAGALELESYNVLQNNGALAGQTVFHAHVHLIPKWSEADGLRRHHEPPPGIDQTGVAEQIRKRLALT